MYSEFFLHCSEFSCMSVASLQFNSLRAHCCFHGSSWLSPDLRGHCFPGRDQSKWHPERSLVQEPHRRPGRDVLDYIYCIYIYIRIYIYMYILHIHIHIIFTYTYSIYIYIYIYI